MKRKVTKEMIGAAHNILLQKGDFVLSANLLERIYLAMVNRQELDDAYFDGDTNDIQLAEIAKRDKVIELCRQRLITAKQHICYESYGDAMSALSEALAAINWLGKK